MNVDTRFMFGFKLIKHSSDLKGEIQKQFFLENFHESSKH